MGRRVLIIEDDPDIIHLLHYVVARAGCESVLASGGRQGLRLAQKNGPDLILLDLMMDDMDGWSTLEALKADEQLSAIPVIIVTVKQEVEDYDQIDAHAGMFEAWVSKPFKVDELVDRINKVLE
jgi:DNA-binding response OmpR family regulator